jgi:hypothetical protein
MAINKPIMTAKEYTTFRTSPPIWVMSSSNWSSLTASPGRSEPAPPTLRLALALVCELLLRSLRLLAPCGGFVSPAVAVCLHVRKHCLEVGQALFGLCGTLAEGLSRVLVVRRVVPAVA